VGVQIRSWAGLIQYPNELEVPSGVLRPVPQLAMYADRMVCELDSGKCQQVVQSSKSLKNTGARTTKDGQQGEEEGGQAERASRGYKLAFNEATDACIASGCLAAGMIPSSLRCSRPATTITQASWLWTARQRERGWARRWPWRGWWRRDKGSQKKCVRCLCYW